MSAYPGFGEDDSEREWGCPVLVSFILHALLIGLALLASSFSLPDRESEPEYTVHLVDGSTLNRSSLNAMPGEGIKPEATPVPKSPSPPAADFPEKKIDLSRGAPEAPLGAGDTEYEKTIKTLALKHKISDREKGIRDEYIKASMQKTKNRIQEEAAGKKAMEGPKTVPPEDAGENRKRSDALARIRDRINRDMTNSAGAGSGSPATGKTARGDFAASIYEMKIREIIMGNWTLLPELKKRRDLEAVIEVNISRNGSIENILWIKKSGNAYFDGSAARAVRISNPFPPVPPDVQDRTLEVSFRPELSF
ncbi:MAG: cell envelope integrity protein TolA [Pseudomonadota bacterium]